MASGAPEDYYVAASLGVPVIALALIGLPVALASYRERGMLHRFHAYGVTTTQIILAQAAVTLGLAVAGAVLVVAIALPTYGIPTPADPAGVLLGFGVAACALLAIGTAIGLAAPSARAAQAIGLLAFFPLYLLGGGGPPTGAMTGPLHMISDALPSAVHAVSDPWLGLPGLPTQLLWLAVWGLAAIAAIAWLTARNDARPLRSWARRTPSPARATNQPA